MSTDTDTDWVATKLINQTRIVLMVNARTDGQPTAWAVCSAKRMPKGWFYDHSRFFLSLDNARQEFEDRTI
jgi:hypothetical protein